METFMPYQTIEVVEQQHQIFVTILEKRIYLGVTDIFAEEMSDILNKEFDKLVIDLKNVSVMNSSGIGVLIKARDVVVKKDKSIKLVNLQSLMKDIFSRMRLDTLFEIGVD